MSNSLNIDRCYLVAAHIKKQKWEIPQCNSWFHAQASSLFEPMTWRQFYSITPRQPKIDMTQASYNVSTRAPHTHADRFWEMSARQAQPSTKHRWSLVIWDEIFVHAAGLHAHFWTAAEVSMLVWIKEKHFPYHMAHKQWKSITITKDNPSVLIPTLLPLDLNTFCYSMSI